MARRKKDRPRLVLTDFVKQIPPRPAPPLTAAVIGAEIERIELCTHHAQQLIQALGAFIRENQYVSHPSAASAYAQALAALNTAYAAVGAAREIKRNELYRLSLDSPAINKGATTASVDASTETE